MDKTVIKKLRKKKGWSVKDLALKLGRSPRTIEGWEQGRTIPDAAIETLKVLERGNNV